MSAKSFIWGILAASLIGIGAYHLIGRSVGQEIRIPSPSREERTTDEESSDAGFPTHPDAVVVYPDVDYIPSRPIIDLTVRPAGAVEWSENESGDELPLEEILEVSSSAGSTSSRLVGYKEINLVPGTYKCRLANRGELLDSVSFARATVPVSDPDAGFYARDAEHVDGGSSFSRVAIYTNGSTRAVALLDGGHKYIDGGVVVSGTLPESKKAKLSWTRVKGYKEGVKEVEFELPETGIDMIYRLTMKIKEGNNNPYPMELHLRVNPATYDSETSGADASVGDSGLDALVDAVISDAIPVDSGKKDAGHFLVFPGTRPITLRH